MKKESLKLNDLVNAELKLAEQSMIKGGESSAVPGDDTTCHCVAISEGGHRGSTKAEAYGKKMELLHNLCIPKH